jgi:hypothetical protein
MSLDVAQVSDGNIHRRLKIDLGHRFGLIVSE